QIKTADIVVINKTDLVIPDQLAALRARVEVIVPRARIWETTYGMLPLELLFNKQFINALDAPRRRAPDRQTLAPHGHRPEERFEAWSYQGGVPWSFQALEQALTTLPRGIYRAKGTVLLDVNTGDHGILQLTGRRSWVRLCEPADGRPATTELI